MFRKETGHKRMKEREGGEDNVFGRTNVGIRGEATSSPSHEICLISCGMGVWPGKVSMAVIGALKYPKRLCADYSRFPSIICNVRLFLPYTFSSYHFTF